MRCRRRLLFSSAEVSTPRLCWQSPRTKDSQAHALSFRYGQRHEAELEAAARVAEAIGVEAHVVANIDLSMFGGSALTDAIDVPKERSDSEMSEVIPSHLRARTERRLLSIALAWAEVLEAEDVFIGVNALDYSGYPDCRPEYIRAFEQMADLATKAAVEGTQRLPIHAPLIDLTKAQIIERGVGLGIDSASRTVATTPTPKVWPAGFCDSCALRRKGFREAGIPDPDRLPGAHRSSRMTYTVKEIFYTLQGEGTHDGQTGGLLPLLRMQPLDGARGGSREARSAPSVTPTSLVSDRTVGSSARRMISPMQLRVAGRP